ncbi:transketolase [bacterium (candidate division B38) B3_B38]|nr:MAG: transketolase [bacterium (candidate division B38) B3_B38]
MSLTQEKVKELEKIALQIRRMVVKMVFTAQSGHLGGSLSVAEIISVLYFSELRIDPRNPNWPDRDRLVPSKGHCAPAIYAALALRGFIDPECLTTLRQLDSILQGHPCMTSTPGIDMSTGSLGHGLSIGVGMALGGRLKRSNFLVYVLLGDGELNEGQNWEAAMAATKLSLSNLIAIVDRNRIQLDGPTEEIMPLEPLMEKWKAFNWNTISIDGHSVEEISDSIQWAKENQDRPSVIIANTIKGKGVSFMENTHKWHGRPPTREEYEMAIRELEGEIDE